MNTTTSFDPTSQANLVASAILLLGLLCIVSVSYTIGKFKKDKYKLNTGISISFSALTAIAGAMYIFFAYD